MSTRAQSLLAADCRRTASIRSRALLSHCSQMATSCSPRSHRASDSSRGGRACLELIDDDRKLVASLFVRHCFWR